MAKADTNLAYDFGELEQYYFAPAKRPKQPPELKVVSSRQANTVGLRSMAAFVLIIAIIAAILYNNMLLTELTSEIETAQQSYETLQNEQRLMQLTLEGKTSLRTVQEIAEQQLGMAKAESYQVQYIDLGEGDRVVLAKAPKLTLADHIRMAYRSVLEYLGFA